MESVFLFYAVKRFPLDVVMLLMVNWPRLLAELYYTDCVCKMHDSTYKGK